MGRVIQRCCNWGWGIGLLLLANGLWAQPIYDSVKVDDALQLIAPASVVQIVTFVHVDAIDGGKSWTPDSLTLRQAATGNLPQLLATLPSLSFKQYAPGGLATPALRGTGAGHTQVYWEGLPLNSSMLGQQDLALGASNLFNQVDAFYGGSSLTLGSGGIGGAILLGSRPVTRQPYQSQLRLRQLWGSFAHVSSNLEFDYVSQRYFGSSTRLYFNTAENSFPFRNTGVLGTPRERLRNAGILQFGGTQEVHWSIQRNRFLAKLWILDADRSLPPTMLTGYTAESQQDQAIRGVIGWNRWVGNGDFDFRGGYFREWMVYQHPTARIYSAAESERIAGELKYRVRSPQHKLLIRQLGLRYVHDQARSDGYVGGADQDLLSAMGRGDWRIKGESSLALLLRQEWYDGRFSPFLAYLGGRFKTPLRGVSAHVNLARNYRYPSLNDRFWQPGGNPDLRPELSHSAEVQLKRQFPGSHAFPRSTTWEIGAYYNHVDDWILWVPGTGSIWHPENVRKVNAMGIEAHVTQTFWLAWGDQLQIQANYTLSSTRDQDGYQLIYTPQHNAFMRLYFQHRGLGMQYFQDWNSKRYTTTDNLAAIQGYSTGDLSLSWQFRAKHKVERDPAYSPTDHASNEAAFQNNFNFQAGLRNIWNAQYQTVAWRPMPGRSFFVRMDWTLAAIKKK